MRSLLPVAAESHSTQRSHGASSASTRSPLAPAATPDTCLLPAVGLDAVVCPPSLEVVATPAAANTVGTSKLTTVAAATRVAGTRSAAPGHRPQYTTPPVASTHSV
eukprot:GHVU01047840.1.p4 GENE.GHVU01047840.1~~GHVU01047840.1.p4  ORF type:complete len:106 (-),score=5.94 GHVU01047840.1:1201-1518(-)